MRSREDYIDILKALAIGAVVAIHAMGRYYALYPEWSDQWNNLVVWDQILRFCVPLFVALSGLVFALKYKTGTINLKEFLVRRVLRILPLYFLWAVLSFWVGEQKYSFWESIFLGRADYHLYFVLMILQLYILFPALFYLIKKFPKIILVLVLIWQIYLFKFIFPGQYSDQNQYLFFGSWIYYFVLGIYLGLYQIKNFWARVLVFIPLVLGPFLAIVDTLQKARAPQDLIIATRFTKVSVLIYASSVILTGIFWGKYLDNLPNFLKRPLVFVGKNSYLIYLSHVLILRYLYRYF